MYAYLMSAENSGELFIIKTIKRIATLVEGRKGGNSVEFEVVFMHHHKKLVN
jgi:hypothetical protein